ncbi:hypothetical protein N0V94_008849 [Neodidymelliopsis sp. IMI 364377]|nr:hypothetical protein N0V94_008849 [Neodidymelliopsis sp. IMI 364377]
MAPRQPQYTRDQLVTIISDFYTFLTKLHIPTSALKHPPPEGWPSITPETTRGFKKSPFAIEVLRHLPYIDEKDAGEMITHIHYKCDVVDWSARSPEDFTHEGNERFPTGEMGTRFWAEDNEATMRRRREERDAELGVDGSNDEGTAEVESQNHTVNNGRRDSQQQDPGSSDEDEEDSDLESEWDDGPEAADYPNFIGLAQGYESGGRDLVLDVYKGVIYEDMIRFQHLGSHDVESFFAKLRDQYEKLELVPIRGEMLEAEVDDQDDEEMEEYRAIYRSHGWPGEGFRKEEALEAVERCRLRREGEE